MTLNSLPLFPLGTVLFPGGLLPLRIFEVRYLDMIGKCVKSGAPFGVISLTRGSEVRAPGVAEAFGSVGTMARIDHCESPQPGLLMIQCTGTQRFRVRQSTQLKHGLWTADVDLLDDDQRVAVPDDLLGASRAMDKLIGNLRARNPDAQALPLAEPFELQDCGWLANRWCELLPLPPELRQRLMELDNPLLRLELVNDLLERNGLIDA